MSSERWSTSNASILSPSSKRNRSTGTVTGDDDGNDDDNDDVDGVGDSVDCVCVVKKYTNLSASPSNEQDFLARSFLTSKEEGRQRDF